MVRPPREIVSDELMPWSEDILECHSCGYVVKVTRQLGLDVVCPKCSTHEMWHYEPQNLALPTYQ